MKLTLWMLLAAAATATAGEGTLRYRFTPGEAFAMTCVTETVSTGSVTRTVSGNGPTTSQTSPVVFESTLTVTGRLTVRSVDAGGTATLAETIDRVRYRQTDTGALSDPTPLEFDSDEGRDPRGPFLSRLKPLAEAVGGPIWYRVTPEGAATATEGGKPASPLPTVRLLPRLPGGPATEGRAWTGAAPWSPEKRPSLGYRVAGVDGGVATVRTDTDVWESKGSLPAGAGGTTEYVLRSQFDAASGRLLESERTAQVPAADADEAPIVVVVETLRLTPIKAK